MNRDKISVGDSLMPTALANASNTSMETVPHALTEMLVETIVSHAQILKLLDADRYTELLKELPSVNPSPLWLTQDEEKVAWDDVEHWIVTFREQDQN
jgi:hypothetical protein